LTRPACLSSPVSEDEDKAPVEGQVCDLGLVRVDVLDDVVRERAVLAQQEEHRGQHRLLAFAEVSPVPLEDLGQEQRLGDTEERRETETESERVMRSVGGQWRMRLTCRLLHASGGRRRQHASAPRARRRGPREWSEAGRSGRQRRE
jgi:hypothetical protein